MYKGAFEPTDDIIFRDTSKAAMNKMLVIANDCCKTSLLLSLMLVTVTGTSVKLFTCFCFLFK